MNKGLISMLGSGLILTIITILVAASIAAGQGITADHTWCTGENFRLYQTIPDSVKQDIMDNYPFYYHHTSHGGQILSGMVYMRNAEGWPDYATTQVTEVASHVGADGDTSWAPSFRNYLNNHPECKIASISWCWEHQYYTEEQTQMYCEKMTELDDAYPNVTFVFQTGRLNGGGIDGNVYRHNNQIREYCAAHNEVLFDFADIESWDPDGNYYPDESDACGWCSDWCAEVSHDCGDDCACAHSHCFNCWQKGHVWWLLMARLTGWTFAETTDYDINADGADDLLDILFLIQYFYHGGTAPDPIAKADFDDDGMVDIADLMQLVAYIYWPIEL
ncbi:MAG: hypothetical protein JW763_05940 [candidate division Zixibacteria bacterium]|nr:hypothetical protein [candidate division Zixibacteria bacterium]